MGRRKIEIRPIKDDRNRSVYGPPPLFYFNPVNANGFLVAAPS
jgi:hypothetical protein